MNNELKLDMRKTKQTFIGKYGIEYTLNRHRVANNLGMYTTYHTLWAFGEQRNIFAPESADMTAYKKHLAKHLAQYI